MHLKQSKKDSRETGGQQYWLQGIPAWLKNHLDKEKTCPVVLQTPYGITKTTFTALHPDWKLHSQKGLIAANSQHYRVQADEAGASIGEAIRHWYGIGGRQDFERVEVEAIQTKGHFVLVPTAVTMRGTERMKILEKVISPLSFHRDYQSKFWKKQIEVCRKVSANEVAWAGSQIRRVVTDHQNADTKNIHEADLLRAAGALSVFGLDLSLYLTKGYDCPKSRFSFSGLPTYQCPVEIKKRSARFDYQIMRYPELPRAVVLCIEHDLVNPPDHVDVLELSALAEYLK